MLNGEEIDGLYVDRYELAMAAAYWREGRVEEPACFDYFFRRLPFGGGYVVFAGLETLIEALGRFRFSEEDLVFLAQDGFPEAFLDTLRDFRFRGRIHAPREGELVFPLEPVVRVEGGLLETQLLETLLLNVLNFQSLIATKAARCMGEAEGRGISEFGLRRAQGPGGFWASRAALVGGCGSTSNTAAGRIYGVPVAGTMAHSFVQSYDDELSAFRAFAATHGSKTILLLDSYDTLGSGLPNAIRVAREMEAEGEALRGVRIDSGDLAGLARGVREGLDAEGLRKVRIVASNEMDEWSIRELLRDGAPIDLFGIGTRLAVGLPDAALDGVYKLAMLDGRPRMKFSDTIEKTTVPGVKTVNRFFDDEGWLAGDAIHLDGSGPPPERMRLISGGGPGTEVELTGFRAEPLHEKVFEDGERCGAVVPVLEAADYCRGRLEALPEKYRRLEAPEIYRVGLDPELEKLRNETHRELERKAMYESSDPG